MANKKAKMSLSDNKSTLIKLLNHIARYRLLLVGIGREHCATAARCSAEENRRGAAEIEPFCTVVSEMTELISSRHTARLKSGECSYEAGSLFVGTLIDVERIAKHCSNIGVSLAVQYRRGTLSEEEFVRRIHRGDTEHFVEHYISYKNEYYSPLTEK